MAEYLYMPNLGLTMTEGTIETWVKSEGDKIEVGEVFVNIENNKSVEEVESRSAGVLLKILVEEGDTVEVGTPIGIIGEAGEDISAML